MNNQTATKLTPRQIQAQRTKDRIYQSALRVMSRVGYQDTTISAITKDAGVSAGSFYTYFTSKEQLLLHTFIKSEENYEEYYHQVSDMEFPENLYAFTNSTYFSLEQRGEQIQYGIYCNILTPEYKQYLMNPERQFFQYMRLFVNTGIEQGKLSKDISVDDYVEKIFSTLTGIELYWCLSDFHKNLSVLAENAIRDLMNGLMI